MNMRLPTTVVPIFLLLGLVALSSPAAAAPDYASFESFYRQSWVASPWAWVIAAVAAIIAAAVVLFFTPAAGPVVTTIGTWLGSLFGFSGIAATNFGLALLGGGALAAGGFGIVGGTAVLTAALTFGTEIVFDYAASTVVERYQYQRFVEASQKMTTLPIPRNTRGPKEYRAALKVLESINPNESLSSPKNRAHILAAVKKLPSTHTRERPLADSVRHDSLLALLYFVADDYVNARKYGNSALSAARRLEMKATLPSFIVAASSLYGDTVDFDKSLEYFRYSIQVEPDNPLATLLFAVFLDRLMYRLNDGTLSAQDLAAVARVADGAKLKESCEPVQIVLLARYLMIVKLEQQKISSLTQAFNSTIRNSPSTLATVETSLSEYDLLLSAARPLASSLLMTSALDKPDVPPEMKSIKQLLLSYADDRVRLEALIGSLDRYQRCVGTPAEPTLAAASSQSARIGHLLGEAGLYYDIDEDCVFGVNYQLTPERSQVVWLSGTHVLSEDLPIWWVWSMAAELSPNPPPELMFRALKQNSEMTVGAWELVPEDSNYLLMLRAPVVGSDMSSGQLTAVLEAVMEAADAMEQSLVADDEF